MLVYGSVQNRTESSVIERCSEIPISAAGLLEKSGPKSIILGSISLYLPTLGFQER